MEEIRATCAALEEAAVPIVSLHREAGILTWSLLHLMASEVLAQVAATGVHDPEALSMLRVPEDMPYPRDLRPVSFKGHELIPFVFTAIELAWNRVH